MSEAVVSVEADCPVCGARGVVEAVDRKAVERMARALDQVALPQASDHGWRLGRCPRCELEFAVPMKAPGSAFYQWLVRSGLRYPGTRWEWSEACTLIRRRADRASTDLMVVDVGSGDGGFLRALACVRRCCATGLEHNPDLVEECRREGLNVIRGDLRDAHAFFPTGVDVITLWHVVEHVEEPVALLELARSRLRVGGEILFSVPITPMSYEAAWPDPFNEPPHHLTRWNLRSLDALARRIGMEAEYILPKAASLPMRVARSLLLQSHPSSTARPRFEKLASVVSLVVRNPRLLVLEALAQMRRERHLGATLPDFVLVRLREKPCAASPA